MATTFPIKETTTVSVPQEDGSDVEMELEVPPLVTGSKRVVPAGYHEIEVPGMPGRTAIVPKNVQVAFGNDGNLYHCVPRVGEALRARPKMVWRRLAMTKQESLANRLDYYDPTLGLIWEGYKVARDRDPQDIMNDTSIGGLPIPGELTVEQAGFDPDAESAE